MNALARVIDARRLLDKAVSQTNQQQWAYLLQGEDYGALRAALLDLQRRLEILDTGLTYAKHK